MENVEILAVIPQTAKMFLFPQFPLYLDAICYSNFRVQRMLAGIVAAMLYGISGYEKHREKAQFY